MTHATLKLKAQRSAPRVPAAKVAEALVVAAVAIGIVLFAATFSDPERFPIREIRVEGDTTRIGNARFKDKLSEATRAGLFGIDVKALRGTLLAEPWVADVSIRRVWPDTLVVAVQEQVPVARWNDGLAVNAYGDVFDPQDAKLPQDLVRLSGPASQVVAVMRRLDELKPVFEARGLTITHLEFDPRSTWQVTLAGGQRIVLGSDRLEERLARFGLGYESFLKKQWPRVAALDMRYPNGFAVRYTGDGTERRAPAAARAE